MIKKRIMIINRGEIAVRIIRTIREMGHESLVVYSTADKDSLAVSMADITVCVGPAPSLESYLNIPNLLVIATSYMVDAIHPGYGFLSERVEFVELCEELQLNFIGPSSSAMALMGDKISALQTASKYMQDQDISFHVVEKREEDLKYIANNLSFPLMLKHSLGGGGKGMRIVKHKHELEKLYDEVVNEAKQTDDNPIVFAEKFIKNAKHIEIQVMADKHGNAIHLGSRDCTMQRNNQKLIEEAPARISQSLLKKMYETSLSIVNEINYVGAGTFEFMVVDDNFYFLEMNTRLQVEHTVTEEVCDVDLVKLQILVALDEKLPLTQRDIKIRGHAIECRINAENPKFNFAPTPGTITDMHFHNVTGLRRDFGVAIGDTISPYYDSMVGKLIIKRLSREVCIKRMISIMNNSYIEGVSNTISFNKALLESDEFKNYTHTTNFIANNIDELIKE